MLLIFFLFNDLNLFITEVIARFSNLTECLAMSIGITTEKAKTAIETHPVTTESKISVQYNIKFFNIFWASYSFNDFVLFH